MSSRQFSLQNLKTRLRESWRPGAWGAAITVILGLLFMSATLGGGLKNLSYDFPFLVRAALPILQPQVPEEVVLVYMDDRSHSELDQPGLQAWDREMHARLIDVLAAQHAKAVVIDVLFDKPAANDAKLIRAAASYGKVLLGGALETIQVEGGALVDQLTIPHPALREVTTWGQVEISGADRIVRSHLIPRDTRFRSLAWKTAEFIKVEPLPNPFAPRWLNYYGPPGALPSHSFVDVLATNFPPATFSNKVVFVGAGYALPYTAGKGTDDFRTPYTSSSRSRSPGVEINATTFLNIARHDWLTGLSGAAQYALVLLLGGAMGFGLTFFRPPAATAVALGTFVLLAGAACFLVWRHQLWFPWLTIGLVQIPVALGWSLLTNSAKLYRDKEALERQLAEAGQRAVLVPAGGTPVATTKTVVTPEGAPIRMLGPDIPNHEMLRCVGKGAYGEVWLARDEIGTYHAVKIISRHKFHDNGPYDREFRGIQQYTPISRAHPGLVQILHVGRNDKAGYFFYIMELGDCEVNGTRVVPESYSAKNLARELHKSVLPVKDCLELGIDLADALHFLHASDLIHRDIKPSNVIFVEGRPKLADVGLVTKVADEGQNVTYLGTEGFIAPEGPGTPAADVFSLGKVIYEASMGRAAAQYPALPTSLTRRDDPKALLQLNEIILRACAPDRRQRHQSAAELRTDLVRLRRELFQSPASPPRS